MLFPFRPASTPSRNWSTSSRQSQNPSWWTTMTEYSTNSPKNKERASSQPAQFAITSSITGGSQWCAISVPGGAVRSASATGKDCTPLITTPMAKDTPSAMTVTASTCHCSSAMYLSHHLALCGEQGPNIDRHCWSLQGFGGGGAAVREPKKENRCSKGRTQEEA